MPRRLLLLAGVLFLGSPTAAEDSDAKALRDRVRELWNEYRDLRSATSLEEVLRRETVVEKLGRVRTGAAARHLFEILKKDRSLGVRLEALTGLARVGDLESLKKTLRYISRQKDTVLPEMLWESLVEAKEPAVGQWLAADVFVIVNRFEDANRFRRVAVNVIGLYLNNALPDKTRLAPDMLDRHEAFFRSLAERTGGECRMINDIPQAK